MGRVTYRAAPKPPPAWLLALDRALPLREFRWFRRRMGGVWVRLCAVLVPGAPEWWHREGIDPPVAMTCNAVDREVHP